MKKIERNSIIFPDLKIPTIENPYGYIYIITNLINNKSYVGQHHSENFDESYWGSGRLIKIAIRKYGKENFSRRIIFWVKSKVEADDKEIYLIDLLNTFHGRGYNMTPGGFGCGSGEDNPAYGKPSHLRGKPLSEEHRKKLSLFLRGRKLSEVHKERLSISQTLYHKNNPHDEEWRRKCSERNKGEKNPMYGRKGENSPIFGRKMPEDQRQKILDWAKDNRNPMAKTLYQYDLDGNFVKSYDSMRLAYDEPEKYEMSTLTKRCRFKQGKRYIPYKGYYWSYAPPVDGKLPPLEVSILAGLRQKTQPAAPVL